MPWQDALQDMKTPKFIVWGNIFLKNPLLEFCYQQIPGTFRANSRQIPTKHAKSLYYMFFLPPLFYQSIPAFWTQNLGKNRLFSANLG